MKIGDKSLVAVTILSNIFKFLFVCLFVFLFLFFRQTLSLPCKRCDVMSNSSHMLYQKGTYIYQGKPRIPNKNNEVHVNYM